MCCLGNSCNPARTVGRWCRATTSHAAATPQTVRATTPEAATCSHYCGHTTTRQAGSDPQSEAESQLTPCSVQQLCSLTVS